MTEPRATIRLDKWLWYARFFKTRALAKKAIEGGQGFAEVAKQHSSCPSGRNGGDLGSFGPGQMVPEFDKAVFNSELNTVIGPIKTQFGYHLLEVTSRS